MEHCVGVFSQSAIVPKKNMFVQSGESVGFQLGPVCSLAKLLKRPQSCQSKYFNQLAHPYSLSALVHLDNFIKAIMSPGLWSSVQYVSGKSQCGEGRDNSHPTQPQING